MKGLLIKDFKLMKNNAMFILIIIFISIGCAAGMKNPFFALGYATAFISIFSVNTIAYDEYDNGMPHLFSLPFSRKTYVKEKYVFAVLISVVGLTIATMISVGVSLFMEEQYGMKDWLGILSLSLFCVILIQGIMLPVRMKFDSEKHKMAMVIVFGAMAAVVGGAFAIAEACGIDLDAFFDGLLITKAWSTFVIVLAFGVILMFVSYKISVTFMEKREF